MCKRWFENFELKLYVARFFRVYEKTLASQRSVGLEVRSGFVGASLQKNCFKVYVPIKSVLLEQPQTVNLYSSSMHIRRANILQKLFRRDICV